MKLFRNAYNFELTEADMEKPKGISLTVPDQTLTIQEILEKHVHGIPIEIGLIPEYEEDPDIDTPDITRAPDVDITDVYDQLVILNEKLAAKATVEADPIVDQPGAVVKE